MKVQVEDPLRKREAFAVSLRKKKRQSIIESKRKRLRPFCQIFDATMAPQSQPMTEIEEKKMIDQAVEHVQTLLTPDQNATLTQS